MIVKNSEELFKFMEWKNRKQCYTKLIWMAEPVKSYLTRDWSRLLYLHLPKQCVWVFNNNRYNSNILKYRIYLYDHFNPEKWIEEWIEYIEIKNRKYTPWEKFLKKHFNNLIK